MVAKTIEVGKYYYYGKLKRRMKCTAIGTSKDKMQSDFVDYKCNKYRFYNHDMHIDRYKPFIIDSFPSDEEIYGAKCSITSYYDDEATANKVCDEMIKWFKCRLSINVNWR